MTTAEGSQRRKLATVLFCDVSGSTALGEHADPEAVRELMFRYFHEMRTGIERHGGTVEKFIGDAVVAVFGVPTAHEDDALRAVRAAAEIQERAAELSEGLERQFGMRIALRIGLNTGEVVAGEAGSRETFVTGDAVNVAARLEQGAMPGQVLLGQATYELVREAVVVESIRPITAKGKAAPIVAHSLLDVRVPHGRPTRRKQTPFVARERDLSALDTALEETLHSCACRLCTVVGDPGVGKSRLAAELVSGASHRVVVLEGRCLSYGEGITYWALDDIIRAGAQIHDEHTPEEAQARLEALLPSEPAAAAHLGRLLGLAEGASTPAEVGLAAREFLRTLARHHPLLLVIDDIHWAEPALLDLIQTFPQTIDAPVFVLCLARPELLESYPEWSPTIRLEPLGESASMAFLTAVLGKATTSGNDLRLRIAGASRGNPLFIEEFIAMLVEQGILVRSNGSWRATRDVADFPIPASITALLSERIDRLEEELRLVLERASVEGEVFHRGAVVALSPEDEQPAVQPRLRRLMEQMLVRPAEASFAGEAAFRFRHLLLREVAYNGTAKRVRSQLHERFACWLEDAVGDRAAEYEEIIGYHLECSYRLRTDLGPPDERARSLSARAAARLASAGARAFRRGDLGGANNLLGRAFNLAEAPAVELAVDLIETKLGLGDYTGALRVADTLAGGTKRARAYGGVYRSFVEIQQQPEGAGETALRRADAAAVVFQGLGDDRGLAKVWALRGSVYMARGELRRFAEAGARCHELALEAGDGRQAADGLKMMDAAAFYGDASASESARLFADHLTWAREHTDLGSEAEILVADAVLKASQGRFQEAKEVAERGERLLRELANYAHLSVFGASAQIALLEGDYAEAERLLRRSYNTLEQSGEKGYLSTVAFSLARALLEQGKLSEARAFARRSAALGASDDVITQFGWRIAEARVLAELGESEQAERLAREAVSLIAGTEFFTSQAEGLLELGIVLERVGKKEEASRALQRSLALWERKQNQVMASRVRERLTGLGSMVGSPAL